LPKGAAALSEAHLLLREHGKTVCKDARPQCFECPLEKLCSFAARR